MRFFSRLSATVGLLAIASIAYAQRTSTGTLYFSQDDNGNGLYVLNTATGQATLVGAGNSGVTSSTVGLAESANPNLLIGSIWTDIVQIATDGSSATVLPDSIDAEGLAYDPTSNLVYGAINGDFFTVNPATGALISNLTGAPADVEGLAWSPVNGGTIFALEGGADGLFAYTISSGSWSLVGNTGVNLDSTGLAYDPTSDVLYAVGDGDQNLYRINPANAQLTTVGPRGIQSGSLGGGLAFVPFASAAPEPGTLALGLLPLAGVAVARRRRK